MRCEEIYIKTEEKMVLVQRRPLDSILQNIQLGNFNSGSYDRRCFKLYATDPNKNYLGVGVRKLVSIGMPSYMNGHHQMQTVPLITR